jgi:hypothetical protein
MILALFVSMNLMATAAEWREYSWSRELPEEIASGKPATNRTVAAVDALFAGERITLDDVVARLGRPDGFSRQALGSRTVGSAEPQERGGTLRFDLAGDNVLLVRTGDFHVIYEAFRFDRKGKGTLLEK